MKKVAVLFSGGLDSTYLIWKNLKDGNIVFPIYVEIENNEIKTILEKNRTELLYNEFVKEFNSPDTYEKKIHEIHHAISVGVRAREDSLYFKQMPIWLFSVMFMQSMEVDEIQIGYVSNDDAISYLSDIKRIYKSYQPICEPLKPLVFPITKMKKYMMFQELPEQYRKLIISCENARIVGSKDAEFVEYEPCCECVPCKTIIASNYYETGAFPQNYNNSLLMQYARQLRKLEHSVVDKDGIDYFEKMCKLEPRKEPHQLSIDFDNEVEYKTEKQYNG
jgi:hypothetical protein